MNAVTARAYADSITQQIEDLDTLIEESTKFLHKAVAGSLDTLYTDGPFQGKTWADVYKECEEAKATRHSLRYPLKDAEFKATCLETIETSGKCYIWISGMDCDCSSYGYATSFDTLKAAEHYRNMMYESADGPMGISAMTKENFDEVQPYSHDLVLAAFEDGHPHSVSEADWTDRG
jgi:hypothetical protein